MCAINLQSSRTQGAPPEPRRSQHSQRELGMIKGRAVPGHLLATSANHWTGDRCHHDRYLWSAHCGRLSMKTYVPERPMSVERTVVQSPLSALGLGCGSGGMTPGLSDPIAISRLNSGPLP